MMENMNTIVNDGIDIKECNEVNNNDNKKKKLTTCEQTDSSPLDIDVADSEKILNNNKQELFENDQDDESTQSELKGEEVEESSNKEKVFLEVIKENVELNTSSDKSTFVEPQQDSFDKKIEENSSIKEETLNDMAASVVEIGIENNNYPKKSIVEVESSENGTATEYNNSEQQQLGQSQESFIEPDETRDTENEANEESSREEEDHTELVDESLYDDYCQVVEHLADREREQETEKHDEESFDQTHGQEAIVDSDKSFVHPTSPPLTILSDYTPASPSRSDPDIISRASSPSSIISNSNQQHDIDDGDGDGENCEEDFCGEMASSSTLRRIKMNTFEDVLVCEQNKQSLDSARRLFDSLVKKQIEQREQHSNLNYNGKNGRASAPLMRILNESQQQKQQQRDRKSGSSFSSDEGVVTNTNSSQQSDNSHEDSPSSSRLEDPYDIKIVRRSGSNASCASNFRQTLVCSVSPTNQLNESNSDLIAQQQQTINNQTELILEHQLYPMDGEEILQCRAAFRENKRIIQEQQERANKMFEQQQELMSYQTNITNDTRFESQVQICSHCNQRLYPVDKMELDFTRTTLNIHRNCFKCHICSSMLR